MGRKAVLACLVWHAASAADGVVSLTNFIDGACAEDYDPTNESIDLFPYKTDLKVSSDYSLNWEVRYERSYKVLTSLLTKEVHVLYQCGTPPPVIPNATLWRIPLTRVATTSTTYLPFLEMIGERKSLKAYTSSFDYVTSPCLRKLNRDGDCVEAVNGWSPDNAKLEALDIELTFATSPGVHNGYLMRDTSEDSVLKIAEYVEVVSLFFNKEALATKAIRHTVENFHCAKAEAEALAAKASAPVKVLWSSYYDGSWAMPSCPQWYCEIIEAAGGEVLLPATFGLRGAVQRWGTERFSNDQIQDFAAKADVWISPGAWGPVIDQPFSNFSQTPAFENKRIFDNQGKSGANDWFERRTVEPDALIQDVAAALYPETTVFGNRTWLRNVLEGEPALTGPPVDFKDLDLACPSIAAPYDYGADESCPEVSEPTAAPTAAQSTTAAQPTAQPTAAQPRTAPQPVFTDAPTANNSSETDNSARLLPRAHLVPPLLVAALALFASS